MINIEKVNDKEYQINGLTEEDLLMLYAISQTCRRRIPATEAVASDADNLSKHLEEFIKTNN
jgi:hypothetical protein